MLRDQFLWLDNSTSILKTPGFVYFIQGDKTGLVKIGWSISVEGRLFTLQAASPDKLIILAWFAGNGRQEKDLHKRFAEARSHGEWFRPVPELMAYIKWTGKGRGRKWKTA